MPCYIGLVTSNAQDLNRELTEVEALGCGYIVSDVWPSDSGSEPMADVALRSKDWYSRVVVKIDLERLLDRNDLSFRGLRDRISYVLHLQAHSVYMELPAERSKLIVLAQIIDLIVGEWPHPKFHFEVPAKFSVDCKKHKDFKDSWSQWNFFRSMIRNPAPTVCIALRIDDLPDRDEQQRWMGEKIKMAILPPETFVFNKSGYPVLGKAVQLFIQSLYDANKLHISLAVRANPNIPNLQYYIQYLNQLLNGKFIPEKDPHIDPCRDQLQVPLQPLKDNLQSGTYEIFEKDPVKYEEYRKAILAAIQDRPGTDKLVIMVVGAGRGPLVEASVKGAEAAERECSIVVVEKNPHAIVTLKYYMQTKWENRPFASVVLHHGDMRGFKTSEKADIVVSELLGSFSDNELSPECLDGVYMAVKPDAISIPQSYTSFLRPIMSRELYEQAQMSQENHDKKWPDASLETGYVVFMKNFYSPSEAKPLFHFEHTQLDLSPESRCNRRFEELSFEIGQDFVCHGFAGYFETVLYKNIVLSINPSTHSQGMFSWFPIYFPLLIPLFVPAGSCLKVCFWRQSDVHRVWYEWCVTDPIVTKIQNSGGRSSSISLY